MINLLVLALEFPPVNSTGCYRYLKFLRFFQEYGIQPVVIAPTLESSLKLWQNRKADDQLLAALPPSIEIIRVPLPSQAYIVKKNIGLKEKLDFYLRYKDNAAELWKPAVVKVIRELLKKQQVDALFISAPPFSLCKLGADLSEQFRLPYILDMRDDWIINKGNPFPTWWHFHRIHKELKTALNKASKVSVVTPQLIAMTRKAYPQMPASKFTVVTNGFDADELKAGPFKTVLSDNNKKIRIGYSGEFYYNPLTHQNTNTTWWKRKGIRKLNYSSHISKEDWTYRSPYFFLETLQRLFERSPELKDRVVFEHIGSTPAWLHGWIKEKGLEENFHAHGFVSKSENLRIQENLDALLATSEKVIDGEHYCISSKLFDAFQLQKPILAFVTEGISKEVLKKSGCSIIFDPDDIEKSAQQLEAFINQPWSFQPDREFLQQFIPKELTRQFADEIKNVLNHQ